MLDHMSPLHWLVCGGGPLILVSGEYVTAWSGYGRAGADDTPGGEARPLGQPDYERACAVGNDLGLVAVDGGQGLVVSTEPMATAWWARSPTEGIMVCWMYGEEEAAVVQSLVRNEEQTWEPSEVTFVVGTHPLYVFDAILPGREATEYLTKYLVVRLDEGHYKVDTAIARPDAQTEVMLHRFRRR